MNSSSLLWKALAASVSVSTSHGISSRTSRGVNAAVPEKGLGATQLAQTSLFPVGFLGFVELNAFQRLGQHGHPHGDMKPVENRFTEVSEIPLRDSYSFATVREECGRLGRMDALFDEKMRHPLGRLLLEPMHEGKGIADALSWQTFAD